MADVEPGLLHMLTRWGKKDLNEDRKLLDAVTPRIVCPYCRKDAELMRAGSFYGWNDWVSTQAWAQRLMWVCRSCDARVGCHRLTAKPLGMMARKELRALREQCHKIFDAYWRAAMRIRSMSKSEARAAAYKWLANRMDIPYEACHFSHFDEVLAEQALSILQQLEVDRRLKQEVRRREQTLGARAVEDEHLQQPMALFDVR